MRHLLLVLPLLLGSVPVAQSQVTVGIGVQLPGLNIGIHLPAMPNLVLVPGYPVYYAPQAQGNYFFHEGLYWVYEADQWYSSTWYNGPWRRVGPEYVPAYVLRVPVRYYRQPPPHFRSWRADAAPRWAEHWGPGWQQRRAGWDRWDRRAVPQPAPIPHYQRKYPQSRYPQQHDQPRLIQYEQYRYQPREALARRQFHEAAMPPTRPPQQRSEPPRSPERGRNDQAAQRRGEDRPQGRDGRPGERGDTWQGPRRDQRDDERKGPGRP